MVGYPGAMKPFRDAYCQGRGMPSARYERELLSRTLYGHARCISWFLRLVKSDYFSADIEFLRSLGSLRSRRELAAEIADFQYHPSNRTFLRRRLRLRVSAEKARRIFERHMKPGAQ